MFSFSKLVTFWLPILSVVVVGKHVSTNGRKTFSTSAYIYNLQRSQRTGQDFASQNLAINILICHKRYHQCVEHLPREFCSPSRKNRTFYIWARRMADRIMAGRYDSFSIGCSPTFVKLALDKEFSYITRHSYTH